jgi:hypothetical protein
VGDGLGVARLPEDPEDPPGFDRREEVLEIQPDHHLAAAVLGGVGASGAAGDEAV